METNRICLHCQRPLGPDEPLDLCAACLAKAGLDTEPGPDAEPMAESDVPPLEELAPLFPQLEIMRLVGRGGMGAVYQARQPALDRFIALKVLPAAASRDPGFAERFNREARALARLSHPSIVAVHDFGIAGRWHYLVMEFVEGVNLRQAERAGRLPPEQALQIIPQICDALQYAHSEGIVHRDIKPENILLGTKGRVKITDFGIAKMVGLAPEKLGLTGARDVVGTPVYMAPEQVERPQSVDHRADLFSLGVVFYEMLTGELPLGRFAPPSRKARVDARLDAVVLRALEKEPERRYQQASQIKAAVATIGVGPRRPPPAAFPGSSPVQPKQRSVVVNVLIMLGLVAPLLLFGILVWFFMRAERNAAPAANRGKSTEPPALKTPSPLTNRPSVRPPTPTATAPGAPRIPGGLRYQWQPAEDYAYQIKPKLEPKQLTADERRDLLLDLQSANWARRQMAASRLSHVQPAAPKEDVARSLARLLSDSNQFARQHGARALGVWGTPETFQPLIQTLADPEFAVRWAAIDALAQLKDPRAAGPLAQHLARGTDVMQAAQALKALGAPAEDAVLAVFQTANREARHQVFDVLKEIGTRKSVPALMAAARSSDGLAVLMAKDALNAIEARQTKGLGR